MPRRERGTLIAQERKRAFGITTCYAGAAACEAEPSAAPDTQDVCA